MDSSPISIDNTSSKNYDEMRNMNYSDFHVQTKIIENIDGEHSDKNSDDSCTDYGGENRETEGYNNDIASEKYEEKFEGDFMSGDEYVESSAASNYGKYKDINPDDLISFYEKESNEDIKDDESIKTNKIDHYLDKNYKGEIIIDGKNEVDEFLLVSRMAYYDIANQSKDKIYENKENNSLYFLKDQASKECTNEDDYDGEHNHGPLLASPKKNLNNNSKDIESICNNMRDSQHEGKNPFNTNQANIDNIEKQYTDNSSEESECETRSICSFQNDKDEIADDDSNSNSQTEALDNEASKKCDNGEKKKSKVRSHIIPHTGKYEKEDRIRLMGIPEYVQKGLKIEKIGRLIKKDNDILTIHSLNSKYYLSAASVLCLENRKIIGCIVDVCSNETEVFYYVKLVFPSLEAEIKENIDIYADLKHSLYINVGTGLCSELFKVLKNKSVPYIFINYNDLYNISETQLMEKHSDTNSGNNNNNPNDNKGNNGKRDERNNNNKDKKRKKNFKGQNKNLQIFNNGKNNRKNNPNNIVNTNSENNNIIPYEKSGKMNHSRKYKKGKGFGNLPSSSQNMNLKFKNLSYVNNSNINEMGNMISKRGHNNSNVGKNNAYNIGHDNNPNNTNYMYANHSLNNIANMGTLNNSNQNEYNPFHNATHNYKKHKMHNYNMNYANIYNNHQNNVNMAYPNESSNHMHPQNYYDIHRTNFINFNNPPNLDNKMQNIIYPQPMEPGSNSYINRPPTNWNSDHISHNKYNDNYTNYINGKEKYPYISQKSYNNKIPQEPINKIMFNNNNDIPSNYNSININNLYNYNDFNSKN